MWSQKAAEITEKVRTSRFGRQTLGPKVARPLARWLTDTFGEDDRAVPPVAEPNEPTPADTLVCQAENEEPTEPTGPADPGRATAKGVALAVKDRIKEHNLVVVAAGIAFWGLLAIPALLAATVSIAGLLLDPTTVKDQVNDNLTGLPEEARTIVGDQLANVSSSSTGGLITGIVVGILLALWTTSGAMAKVMSTLNTIYGTDEGRKFWKLRGIALLLTLGGILFVSGSVFLLAVLPPLLREVDSVGGSAATLLNWLRFPLLGIVMVVSLGLLFHLGPDRAGRYRIFTAGPFVATGLWLALSALFSVYTSTVGSYNETYGSLGGLVILLLWLFITAFVVLIGAEIHALTDSDRGDPPPVDTAPRGSGT
jgi:membrane protein